MTEPSTRTDDQRTADETGRRGPADRRDRTNGATGDAGENAAGRLAFEPATSGPPSGSQATRSTILDRSETRSTTGRARHADVRESRPGPPSSRRSPPTEAAPLAQQGRRGDRGRERQARREVADLGHRPARVAARRSEPTDERPDDASAGRRRRDRRGRDTVDERRRRRRRTRSTTDATRRTAGPGHAEPSDILRGHERPPHRPPR